MYKVVPWDKERAKEMVEMVMDLYDEEDMSYLISGFVAMDAFNTIRKAYEEIGQSTDNLELIYAESVVRVEAIIGNDNLMIGEIN